LDARALLAAMDDVDPPFAGNFLFRRWPQLSPHAARSSPSVDPNMRHSNHRLSNLIFLAIVLGAVFIDRPPLLREAIIVGCAVASYFATPKELHEKNDFSFAPLREVAWLFFGIFLTMMPVLDFMRLHAAKLPINSPEGFYWLSGGLSSVLDNAPTYLTLLANAMGRHNLTLESATDVQSFLHFGGAHLAAISMGAVFFGATTYIGNSPNFMVKAITEREGVHTPSFFGFIFKFAVPVLLPVFYLVGWFNFRR
jgi:Na+/H+ antiporter NhaD/arsenite permease-like protein